MHCIVLDYIRFYGSGTVRMEADSETTVNDTRSMRPATPEHKRCYDAT